MKTGKSYDGCFCRYRREYVNYRVEKELTDNVASIGSVATLPANP